MTKWIKNYDDIAKTPARQMALDIVSAGLDAIETTAVINSAVSFSENTLKIKNETFDLAGYERILVIGFGKASALAASALENILGDKITAGVVIDVNTIESQRIKSVKGSHPKPSPENIAASKNIVDLAQGLTDKDLVIVVVSGGGSAMLCWPETECAQSQQLYDQFLKTGGNIEELNTIRKHISGIKGGGLAKLFHPARIVGLIFCDIPGGKFEQVASGPTYQDASTLADAEKVLQKYGLTGLNLNETPKEAEYFEKVTNIPMVSNDTALQAISKKAKSLGLTTKIISGEIYDSAEETLKKFQAAAASSDLVIGGGEIQLVIKSGGGRGGRNLFLALTAIASIKENQIFISLASDGADNSDAAGAIVDQLTVKKYKDANLNPARHFETYDAYGFFAITEDLIITGQTGANVADLMILLNYAP